MIVYTGVLTEVRLCSRTQNDAPGKIRTVFPIYQIGVPKNAEYSVVMQHLSHDNRRATLDIDLDFIRYSISDESIRRFVKALNRGNNEYIVEITRRIEELKHKDYSGKRVYISIGDSSGSTIQTKLDIGVHKDIDLAQTSLCFDYGKLDEGVTLLANSKEQIVVEKLKSLLRIGAASTRYKDVFDIYYLTVECELNRDAFVKAISICRFH